MSLILHDNGAYSFKLVASPTVTKLAEWIKQHNLPLTVEVGPTPVSFWLTQAYLSSLAGPIGYMGCMGPRGPGEKTEDNRPPFGAKSQLIVIKGRISDDRTVLSDFIIAQGAKPQDVIQPLVYTPKYNYVQVKHGWYKRSGFDAAYQAMKVVVPELTEKEFACTWVRCDSYGNGEDHGFNSMMVECRPYTTDEECLDVVESTQPGDIKEYAFSISSLDSDLDGNLDSIKWFLGCASSKFLA